MAYPEEILSTQKTAAELLCSLRELAHETFAIVDVETTGGNPRIDGIIEVCALKANLRSGVISNYSTLVECAAQVPARITALTGITGDMVASAPAAPLVFGELAAVLDSAILVAHNIEFDLKFISVACARLEIPLKICKTLCTVKLARLLLPELPSRSLPHLVSHFGIDVGRSHRAQPDAEACWYVLEILLRLALHGDEGEVLALFSREWLTLKQVRELTGGKVAKLARVLESPAVERRFSQTRGVWLYRRGSVEGLFGLRGVIRQKVTTAQLPLLFEV